MFTYFKLPFCNFFLFFFSVVSAIMSEFKTMLSYIFHDFIRWNDPYIHGIDFSRAKVTTSRKLQPSERNDRKLQLLSSN